jgi:glycerol-3-phosphate cytidylyltransferase
MINKHMSNRQNISKSCYEFADNTTDKDIYDQHTISQIQNIRFHCSNHGLKIGFTCSTFDLLHPGHIIMLQDAKNNCDFLVVGLQTDPTIDRPDSKNTPIQNFTERSIMINACKYVDAIINYSTENDLYNILDELKPTVRILGSDWKDKQYTGCDINDIYIVFHDRTKHSYSTTNLRKRVYDAEIRQNKK